MATLTGTWIGALFWESIRAIERGAALERCIFRAGGDGGAASAVWLIRAAPAVEPLSCSCASAITSSRIYSSPGVCLLSLSVTYTLPQLSGSLRGYWRSPSVYRTLVYWAEVRYPSLIWVFFPAFMKTLLVIKCVKWHRLLSIICLLVGWFWDITLAVMLIILWPLTVTVSI